MPERNALQFMKERFPGRIQDLLMEFGKVGDALGVSVYAWVGLSRDIFVESRKF